MVESVTSVGNQPTASIGNLELVKKALGAQADYYDVDIKNVLEPAQRDILEVEGCPISLRNMSKNPGPFVILRSKLLRCQHVMVWDALKARAPNVPIGLKSYCTNFFHSVRMTAPEFQQALAPPRDPPTNNRVCSIELKICHLLTDTDDLALNHPMRMTCLMDHRMNKEFLYVSFPDGGGAGPEGVQGRPKFHLKRGRMTVKVVDQTHNQVFVHDSNYDLTQRGSDGGMAYRLVLLDNQTRNCLTIIVQVKQQDNGEGQTEDVIELCWIRYTFGGIQQTASPLLSMASPLQSPAGFGLDLGRSPLTGAAMPSPMNAAHMSWLRTPGSQVLNGPQGLAHGPQGGGAKRPGGGVHDDKSSKPHLYQATSSGPDTLFGNTLANSPIHSGLSGFRGGMPAMTLNSPAVMPHNAGQSPMYPYGSPNFSYLQAMSPVMDPRGMGMTGNQLLQSPAMSLGNMNHQGLTAQMSNITLDRVNAGGSPMLPSMGVPAAGAPPPMHLSTSVNERNPGSAQRGALGQEAVPRAPPMNMMNDCIGKVVYLAKSQSGSRFVQEKLKDHLYFNMFFNEMKDHVGDLMMDNFGHYAIEALFSTCGDEQRLILVMNLAPTIQTVACHKQGSFSIQAMMDTLRTQTQIQMLVEALSKHVMQIILNCSGHYVILRFLSKFGFPYTRFVHRALVGHCYEFSTDHYGLRVMKAAVDAGPHSQLTNVFNCIVKHTNTLVENQYGNYIVQHLLDVCPISITNTIKEKMHGKYVRYSKQKFSSNVVEKCLRQSDKKSGRRNTKSSDSSSVKNDKEDGEEGETSKKEAAAAQKDWRAVIVRELCAKAGELISDKYGNYCLQTALQSATKDPELLADFTASVTPHLESLRENVKAKWVKLLETARVTSKSPHGIAAGGPHPKKGGGPGRRRSDRRPDRGQRSYAARRKGGMPNRGLRGRQD